MRKTNLLKKVVAVFSAAVLATLSVPMIGGTKEVKAATDLSSVITYADGKWTFSKDSGSYEYDGANSENNIFNGSNELKIELLNGSENGLTENFAGGIQNSTSACVELYGSFKIFIPVETGKPGTITITENNKLESSKRYYKLYGKDTTYYNDSAKTVDITFESSDIDANGYIVLIGSTNNTSNRHKIQTIVLSQAATYSVSGSITADTDYNGASVVAYDSTNKKEYSGEISDNSYEISNLPSGTYALYLKNVTNNTLNKLNETTVTVEGDNVLKNLSITETEINGNWDFSKNSETVVIQNTISTFKTLNVNAPEGDAKFSVRATDGDVQINSGTTVSIPVTGAGKVIVTAKSGCTSYSLGGVAATSATSEYEYNGVSHVDLVVNANSQYFTSFKVVPYDEAPNPNPITDTEEFFVQYAKNGEKYNIRFVYPIDETTATSGGYKSLGIECTSNASTQSLTGTDVFESVKSGSTTVEKAGSVYVVVEITDVPASTSFVVSPIGIDTEDEKVSLGSKYAFATPSV